ncbi:hypothetical protein [Bacillus sp. V33-4]|uniref:hypothetical protein n=1 Tax=Bacillus sp. V33-4 TaxID=2054169 RepID=UPI000C77641A|nr:hypothetical protein [Bacillus sp. V33-4]PLR86474.1 hypothetical protein CVD23_06585 [Bacillus sp. V33-4]
MKKKWVWRGGIILLALGIMFAFDRYKLYQEEKPPLPIVTANGKELKPLLGPYRWNNQKEKNKDITPGDLIQGKKPVLVDPLSELKIKFDEQPENITYGWWDPYGLEIYWDGYMWNNGTFTFPNRPDRYTQAIKVEWAKGEATYIIDAEVEKKVSYQEFLSDQKETLSILQVEPPGESMWVNLPFELASETIMNGTAMNMDEFISQFPELPPPPSLPAYFIFDQEKLIFNTADTNALITWLSETLDIEIVSPNWYAKEERKFSVLMILDENDDSPQRLREHEKMAVISEIHVLAESPFAVDKDFDKPLYYIFDNKGMLFNAYTYEDMMMLFEEHARSFQ